LHQWYINGARQAYVDGAGNVVASGALQSNSGIVRPGTDPEFYLSFHGGAPLINFDSNDGLYYDRTFNFYSFLIGSASQAAIGAAGTTIGSPAGGTKGAGTLNAQALYDSGNRVLTSASGAALIAAQSLGSPGYIRLTNGLTLQWGETGLPGFGEGPQAVTFPIAFASAVFSVSATAKNSSGTANDVWTQVSGVGTSGFNVYWQAPSSGNFGGGAYWFAIGI